MVVSKIGPEYTLDIPDPLRKMFSPGQEVAMSVDAQGRLIVTPIEQIEALLRETWGMWADRTDVPSDGVAYMDEIRRGERLNETKAQLDETD